MLNLNDDGVCEECLLRIMMASVPVVAKDGVMAHGLVNLSIPIRVQPRKGWVETRFILGNPGDMGIVDGVEGLS